MPAGNRPSRPGGRSSGRSNSTSSRGGSSRAGSGRPSSGRPSSGRPGSSRTGAAKKSSSSRPSTGRPSTGRTVTGRAADDRRGPAKRTSSRPASGRPSSGRPRRDDERTSRPRRDDDRPKRYSDDRPARPRRDDDRPSRPSSSRPRRDDERTSRPRRDDDRPKRFSDEKPKRREWSSERPKASDDRKRTGRPTGGRPGTGRPGERRDDRARGGRPDRAGGRFGGRDRDERPPRYVSEKRVNVNDPIIPDHITGNELPRNVRNELRTLPDGLALRVARHLAASGEMIDIDPEMAWQHARAALNKASRVGIVREAAAEAAYNAGHFAEALTEFRAARRMRGIKEYWPLMADCERALGRPAKAIAMAADPLVNSLDRASKVEMRIVAAGARVDQGKLDAALATLQCPELSTTSTEPWAARIRYAYADVLEKLGRKDEAMEWFHRAAAVDASEQTDAEERIAALEGVVFEEVEEFDDEE